MQCNFKGDKFYHSIEITGPSLKLELSTGWLPVHPGGIND